ncbi:PIH1 domain-containing protein 1 isoform X2 [Folsomia candida]|nr:PIH1 domain-containing protein 1 isoform X2 [Folsomia candida]
MSNFLDVDDSIIAKNLLLGGISLPETDNDPGGSSTDYRTQILTPSERKEQAQCKFIIPQPGLCIKTRELITNHKVFINLCKSDDVPEPDEYFDDEQLSNILANGSDEEVGLIRLPMSLGEKHIESDKNGVKCPVFEVVINTIFFDAKILPSELYRTFLIVIIIEGIEEKFKMELDKNNYLVLQHKKCIGKLNPQLVKNKPGIKEVKSSRVITDVELTKSSTGPTIKKTLVEEIETKELKLDCTITQVSQAVAKAEIKLPNLKNTAKVFVTLGADRIIVDSPVGQLDIFVPLDIHQEESKAEFDVASNTLSLHLPLVIKP